MNSKIIFEYLEWIAYVKKFVEHYLTLVVKNPNDPAYAKDTDELTCNGFSLNGQDIDISGITHNVYIHTDLSTFAHWLKQKEESES